MAPTESPSEGHKIFFENDSALSCELRQIVLVQHEAFSEARGPILHIQSHAALHNYYISINVWRDERAKQLVAVFFSLCICAMHCSTAVARCSLFTFKRHTKQRDDTVEQLKCIKSLNASATVDGQCHHTICMCFAINFYVLVLPGASTSGRQSIACICTKTHTHSRHANLIQSDYGNVEVRRWSPDQ